jgi:hypothetical protein
VACGRFWGRLTPSRYFGTYLLCEECGRRERRGEGLRILFAPVWEIEATLPPDERFSELWNAARVLLQENADESMVVPTLAFAGLEISMGGKPRP